MPGVPFRLISGELSQNLNYFSRLIILLLSTGYFSIPVAAGQAVVHQDCRLKG